ncbi:GT-D fold domain-containing glycosyltransferase [Helicobacter mesocricetorum]|uniref:GT-D fold domain-containing glycosyltransferase n=1 Tax=Helicobacter mesocricetorum TaxID=87012 RepID=UPI000CF041FB|nr:GT-D fold domain-containing glycosyltransferase [Helicobacter mesocricetorum]
MKYSLKTFINNIKYLARYNLKEMDKKLNTLPDWSDFAELLRDEIKNDFDAIKPPNIKNSFETLEILLQTQKSFIRFGDGEYILMNGGSIGFQKYDANLARALETIITSEDENLLIGLGYNYFRMPPDNARSPWFKYTWVMKNYPIIKKYLIPNKEYGATELSQIYAGYKDYDFKAHYAGLKKLFADKKILLVCGDKVLANVQYNLFEEAQEIATIYGATKHAYESIGVLKEEILKFPKDWVLVFALGPAGKVLGYEMFKLGYRVLDIGHSIKDYDAYKRKLRMDREEISKFFAPDE